MIRFEAVNPNKAEIKVDYIYLINGLFERIKLNHYPIIELGLKTKDSKLSLAIDEDGLQGLLHSYPLPSNGSIEPPPDLRLLNVPYTSPHEVTDIMLLTALTKHMLQEESGDPKISRIGYIVQKSDYLVNRVLKDWGFYQIPEKPTLKFKESEYSALAMDINAFCQSLCGDLSPDEIMALEPDSTEANYKEHSLYQLTLQMAVRKEPNHGIKKPKPSP